MLKLDDAAQHAAWGEYHERRPPGDTDTKTAFEVGWRAAEAAYMTPAPSPNDAPKNAFLLFVIDAGSIQWRSAHPTREEAVAEVNGLRPDGTSSLHQSGMEDLPGTFKSDDCIEFAFVVESPHFASFV